MALFSDESDIEWQTLRVCYELEHKAEVNCLDTAEQLQRLQDKSMCLPHPRAALPPTVHVENDYIFNWIV